MEIIHLLVFHLKARRFGDWILSPSSGAIYCILGDKLALLVGSNCVGST
jgi:hypothetical protein